MGVNEGRNFRLSVGSGKFLYSDSKSENIKVTAEDLPQQWNNKIQFVLTPKNGLKIGIDGKIIGMKNKKEIKSGQKEFLIKTSEKL